MSDHSTTFEVTVTSPHGKQAIDSFNHFLRKVADDAKTRWGIEIQVTEKTEETEHDTDFN